MKNKSAFSIVEIFVVIVIMGVLAAMAIPNYIKGLNRATARTALDSLLAIQASQLVYSEANNNFYASPGIISDVENINQNLHINITPTEGMSYYCSATSICHANRVGSDNFDIGLDLKLPLNRIRMDLVYCNPAGPDSTYNPCCIQTAAQTPGSICP